MAPKTLPIELWLRVFRLLLRAPNVGTGEKGGMTENQGDLASVLRVCTASVSLYLRGEWYTLAAPLLYHRVQTDDLCLLLEGVNNRPLEHIVSKRHLIGQIQHLHVEHDEYDDDEEADPKQKHITHTVRAALNEAGLQRVLAVKQTCIQCATLCVEAAVIPGGEARLIQAISSGDWQEAVKLQREDVEDRGDGIAQRDEGIFRGSTDDSHAAEVTPVDTFCGLQTLAINARQPSVAHRGDPEAYYGGALAATAPQQVCYWFTQADVNHWTPVIGFKEICTEPAPLVAASSPRRQTTVHFDPEVVDKMASSLELLEEVLSGNAAVLDGGHTRWMIPVDRPKRGSDRVGVDDTSTAGLYSHWVWTQIDTAQSYQSLAAFDLTIYFRLIELETSSTRQLIKTFDSGLAVVRTGVLRGKDPNRYKIRWEYVEDFPSCDACLTT